MEQYAKKMAKLYLIPTPIGNLEDITFRAIRLLKECDLILAEDTRQTRILLDKYAIISPLQAHHTHNEHQTVQRIVQMIKHEGKTVALVSDAGTPGISDPGFLLVRECLRMGIEVECLPGPTAFVPALVQSGLPCDRFCFEGFLPHKKGRQSRIKALSVEERTLIFYESPFRLVKLLEELASAFGPDREAAVSRELSKLYAETRRGTLSDLCRHYTQNGIKGEIVVVVAGYAKPAKSSLAP